MEPFWRWFDRCARLDFAGNMLSLLFDWRGWIATAAGGGGGAMTFFWAAIDGRSPLEVWIFAIVAGAALAVLVYFSIGALQKLRPSPNIDAREAPLKSEIKSPDWSLRELFGYLAPHLPLTASKRDGHTTIGTDNEEWEAIGNEVLKQLSIGRLGAIGVGYRNQIQRLNPAPITKEFWLTATFTYWFLDDDGHGILDAKNVAGAQYSDIEVSRADAVAIWPHPLSPSIDRMPFTEVLPIGAALGWDFSTPHLLDLQNAVRQGGVDGILTIWGRLAKYTDAELMKKEPLENIPADHWKEHHAHLFAATGGDNFNVYSWSPAAKFFGKRGYVDLHVKSSQVTPWLRKDAAQFKGANKIK